ncbi:hypothetical protein GE21DRAFT_1305248 [Neurospora crassa]|nr:hypothetical protein 13E11.130 [imported] - Neurospora crassa [Neurospora crassa]KHE88242.1 hypothetical protein GE21DRAFT_1305248 [Neurospora crassa]
MADSGLFACVSARGRTSGCLLRRWCCRRGDKDGRVIKAENLRGGGLTLSGFDGREEVPVFGVIVVGDTGFRGVVSVNHTVGGRRAGVVDHSGAILGKAGT